MALSMSATSSGGSPLAASQADLSFAARRTVAKLQSADQAVRAHEQAHIAAAGGLQVSGPSYSYVQGPDGVRYAIGGDVQIQIPDGRTPRETIQLNAQVQRAALAPVDPSGQDRAVAAMAAQRIARAQMELMKERNGEQAPVSDIWSQAMLAYEQAQNLFAAPGSTLSAVA